MKTKQIRQWLQAIFIVIGLMLIAIVMHSLFNFQ